MKKRIKSLIALGMVMLIGSMSLTGCGATKESPVPESSGETTIVKEKEITKPDKLKWYINVGLTLDDGAEQWRQEFEKKTGISLEFTPQSNNEYLQNLDLAFASKTEPDVFNLAGEDKLSLYAKQGALADLTELVKASPLWNSISKEAWDSVTVDGKIYGVPFEVGTGTITYVRKDWLEKVGMEEPKNYDEFIKMLRAFKEQIPECKIPYTAPGLFENGAVIYLREFYQDATPEFTKVDGKWVDGMSQENMSAALKRMQDAYKDGLIDVEVVTNTTSACRDKWYSGDVGVFNYWAGTWGVSLDNRVKANVPDAKVVGINAIDETKYMVRVPAVTSISATSKNIDGAFKYFIEYMHDGAEGQVLFQHGVENLHWKQDGDKLVMLPKLSKPAEKLEKAFINAEAAPTKLTLTDKNLVVDERITNTLNTLRSNGIQQLAVPSSKKLTKINSDLTALKAQTISKVVMGNISVEEGIKTYLAESKNLGIDEVVEEMNK